MAHVFEEEKKLKARIKRVKGQLDAVERALEDKEDCYKVLQTVAAARGALNGLMSELVENHIKEHVMKDSNKAKSAEDKASLELIKILKTYWK